MANPMQYVQDALKGLNKKQMGSLAFNLSAFGWVGMNLAMGPGGLPGFVPCSYMQPNIVNVLGALSVLSGAGISILAIRMGNLVGPAIALTFLWSVAASFLRAAGALNGLPIH